MIISAIISVPWLDRSTSTVRVGGGGGVCDGGWMVGGVSEMVPD